MPAAISAKASRDLREIRRQSHSPLTAQPRLTRQRARARRLALGALLCAAMTVCITAPMAFWPGDWTWGPRYLFGVVPLLHLGLPEVGLLLGLGCLGCLLRALRLSAR